MHWLFRALRISALAIAGLAASLALAQSFPTRPITFIYPYAAGSTADTGLRAVMQEASKRLGQPIVFENRVGAGGRVGLDAVMRAAPDGYTIGGAANALIVVQALVEPRLFVEPVTHYTPIVLGLETYLLLVSRTHAPFRDFRSLVAHAKANPGKLNAASSGPGTSSHLALAMLGTKAGIDFTSVHYKGLAPAMNAVLSGEVDFTFADAGARPHIEAGKMLGIASTSPQRWRSFPTIPTIQESGLSGFTFGVWHGIIAPPGLPAEVAATLNRAFNEALAAPELRQRLEGIGWSIKGGSSPEFATAIRSDLESFRPIVRAANIKID